MNTEKKWGPWTPHDGGPCPIPDAKAGEYNLRLASGLVLDCLFDEPVLWSGGSADWWMHKAEDAEDNIVAYRVLLPSKPSLTDLERELLDG